MSSTSYPSEINLFNLIGPTIFFEDYDKDLK